MPRVLVLDAEYRGTRAAIERVLEEFPLELDGRTVLVKPNMVGAYPPDSHINTNPAVIAALVEALRVRGASVTVGDNPGTSGYGMVEKSGEGSGLRDASHGSFENIATEVVKVPLKGGETHVSVSRKVMDSDILITVPKFKTHIFTRMTGAIKNSMGFIVGGDKARLHLDYRGYRIFSEMLVELYGIRVPDLAIMDGIVGMHGNGPTNKSLYPVGKLMASDDGVALDTVMCHMMGMKPEKVLMVKLAGEKGLGECDLSRIDVIGDASRLKRFRQPVPSLPQLFGGSFIGAFFPNIGRPRFDVDTSACNECRTCEKSCPAAAVKIEGGSPRYEYSQCIACFCCMELCPKQAIGLQDSLATRIYRLVGQLQNSEMKHFK